MHSRSAPQPAPASPLAAPLAAAVKGARLLVASLAVALAGCAGLPVPVERGESHAIVDVAGTSLAQAAAASRPEDRADLSGFRLLPDGDDAFEARIALIRRAEKAVDVQYYLIANDGTGRQFLAELSAAELLDGVAELMEAGDTYYTAVQTIIPIAATSEIVLTGYYDSFVRRDGDPPASSLLLGYDSELIRAERSLWELARWVRERPELMVWLTATPAAYVVRDLALGRSEELTAAGARAVARDFPELSDLIEEWAA